jgi:hypothetical protein
VLRPQKRTHHQGEIDVSVITTRNNVRTAAFALALVLSVLAMPTPARAATWESCGQWAEWSDGGYNLYNNIWGDGAGEQCIWANSYRNWGVWADHPDTSGVKSYPNSELPNINTSLSDLQSLTSDFDVTVPAAGAYTSTYDIWSGRRYEIMLWMNQEGPIGPWAGAWDEFGNPIPDATDVTVGGHTWNAYYNGGVHGRHVISLLRTSNTSAGSVDILAVLNWIQTQGWIGDITIDEVQFGFEITSSAGGLDFTVNDYSVEYSTTSTAAPAAPSNLTADVAGPDSIDLTWTDNANNEAAYRVERSLTSGSGFVPIADLGANTNGYTDTALTTGTTYYYRVAAYNTGGDSGYSNEASGTPQNLGGGTGLLGDYFDNADLTGLVFTRTDATIDYDWGTSSPDTAIGTDTYSVRWTGYVQPLYTETYTFTTFSDDGDRVWVDGQLLIDNWKIQRGNKTTSGSITLQAGQLYPITVEFYENSGNAAISLSWSSTSQGKQIVPQSQLYLP